MESSNGPNVCWQRRPFPPEKDATWEKHHDRLERRRIARVEVTPESIGLVGCNQVIAVHRERIPLSKPDAKLTCEVGYYATSIPYSESSDSGLIQIVRDHWSAIENGVHYRRDWTYREDDCRVKDRVGAEMLAVLRNLANGLYELEKHRGKTKADSLKNWTAGMTFTMARKSLRA